ncbi:DUF2835 family protein [Vreelandella utahensis]|uniref:DUF2835 family protein n=1 Tax=Vreelandella halophila TaxID=86177 RepID=UPI000985E9F5|nr:DUF2835 family protein [Halomonas utahensis]
MAGESVIVDVVIHRDDWLRVYEGTAWRVWVRARDGRSVVFPARILQPWMEHEGVFGSFMIHYDGDGKFHSVEKIADVPRDTPPSPIG